MEKFNLLKKRVKNYSLLRIRTKKTERKAKSKRIKKRTPRKRKKRTKRGKGKRKIPSDSQISVRNPLYFQKYCQRKLSEKVTSALKKKESLL